MEITTFCNLSCVMCPHGLPGGMASKAHASDKIIDAVLARLDDYDLVRPTGVGEPLMAPGFWRIVEALRGRESPRLCFVTNGILMTQRNVEMLASVALGSTNISMDAARPETYRNIRGNDMRKAIEGIKRFTAMRRERGPEKYWTSMSMVLMRHNIEEVADFVRLAHSLGVYCVYLEHMTMPFGGRKNWVVDRDDFHFVYDDASLFSDPATSDRYMMEALEVAQALDVTFGGPEPFIMPENQRRAQTYPVRRRALGMTSDFSD